jgi:hypothetical protein
MTWFELTFRKLVSHVSHYGLKGPLTFFVVVLSAGCSVGPDYRRTRSCRAGKLAGISARWACYRVGRAYPLVDRFQRSGAQFPG